MGRDRSRAAVAGLAVAALAALAWSGCAVTESNYKTLSFFFDGVPDPRVKAAPESGGSTFSSIDPSKSPNYSVHKPFKEEKCDDCHKSGLKMGRNNATICMKCHKDKPTQYDFMHGPVAAGACLWCHYPHESANAHLLRDTDRKVCGQCHTARMLSTRKVPEHADASRSCLECHFAHGGPAPRMLRTAPTATPSPAPEGK